MPSLAETAVAQLGARIRSVRNRLSREEFAERLGSSAVSVRRYETGERLPDAAFLAALVIEFPDVDPRWLLLGEERAAVLQLPPKLAIDMDLLVECAGTLREVLAEMNIPLNESGFRQALKAFYELELEEREKNNRPAGPAQIIRLVRSLGAGGP